MHPVSVAWMRPALSAAIIALAFASPHEAAQLRNMPIARTTSALRAWVCAFCSAIMLSREDSASGVLVSCWLSRETSRRTIAAASVSQPR